MLLNQLRDLIISYIGLNLQDPEMFPQSASCPLSTLGSHELLSLLLSLSALSTPLYASTTTSQTMLALTEVQPLLEDLAVCFTDLVHGIGGSGGDTAWHGVIGGMEALVGVKPISEMITRMLQWLGEGFRVVVTTANFERLSLMGLLLRLGKFSWE
ncbi:hypothetical protein BDR06DRAFT_1037517 [Suillus hirtellus]|nr:hypothetical protein BDR06DRAFT_1037517 [Suillus hirtellus]